MAAVNNSLAKGNASANSKIVEYDCNGKMVRLSPNIVRNYLVNGNGAVTDQEVAMFLNLCKYQRLNPFLKEAYLIKYGNQPATIVTGKEALTKRAMHNSRYCGQQAGVVVLKEDGNLENRIGTIVLDNEQLVGGWAKVYVKGYEHPVEISVAYDEYVGLKNDGTVNSQWSKKPATMIRKVALMQALREAFPEDLGGMYTAEEAGVDESVLSSEPVEIPQPEPQVIEAEAVMEAEPVQEAVEANDVQQALFGK